MCMEVRTKSFTYNIAEDCRSRHKHQRVGKSIVEFCVQLEVQIPSGNWTPIVRYDTAHGFAHRDWLHADGSCDKIPLLVEDYGQALNYAEGDIKLNWPLYRDRYLEELENEKRKRTC